MGASSDNTPAADDKQTVDLSELQSLSFGPSWTDRKGAEMPKNRERSRHGSDGGRGPSRDRRKGGRPERDASSGGDRPRGDRRPPRRDDRGPAAPRDDFQPIVEVSFYPEDIPFKALSHAMKTNCRTYELFEVARLILEKPERFVVVLHPLKKADGTLPKEFFLSVPDGAPFLSEDAVVAHVLKNHLERFFTTEEAEAEPPKGNFVTVGKCGITGELLGPPNYHRYQALLQEHHAARLPNMPFERFTAKIEQIKDEEAVQQWLDKMKKVTRYRITEPAEGEPETLDGLEAARLFLLTRRRHQVVRKGDHARFPGTAIETLPKGDLRRSVEASLDHQRRFPLETANNLRGRLRRMRFTIYKRGAKGVSFVCAVKRNFREPGTQLSDTVQELIEFIEKTPGVSLGDLPKKFLGIKPEEAIKPDREKAPDIEEVPREQAEAIVEEHEIRRQQRLEEEAQSSEATEAAPVETPAEAVSPGAPAEPPVQEAEAVPAESAQEPAPAEPEQPPQAEVAAKVATAVEDPRLRQLMIDLHWLVHEGYVVEFGDGTLQAVPYAPVEGKGKGKDHDSHDEDDDSDQTEAEPEAIAASSEVTSDETPEPEPEASAPEPETPEPQAEASESDATEAEPSKTE